MKQTIKESRRNHIIQSAQEIFFKRGYSMTSILDVCKMATCSRTTFYSYFESKENLYLAIVKKAFQKFLDSFAELTENLEDKTGLERLLALAMRYLEFAKNEAQYYQLFLDFYGILRNINDTTAQTEAHSKLKTCVYFEEVNQLAQLPFRFLTEEIRRGQMEGTINKTASPTEHTVNIWAYLRGIADVVPVINSVEFQQKDKVDLEHSIMKVIRVMLEE